MNRIAISVAALAVAGGWVSPAQAQSDDAATMARELAELRAQMRAMANRIDSLESQLAETNVRAEAASVAAASARETAKTAAATTVSPPVGVTWKGAPQFESEDGWSFKIRGRVNVDAGFTDAPDSTGRDDGFGSEVRRARLGAEGKVPGGFGYKLEADFASNDVEVADAYVSYTGKGLTIVAGHQNNFQSLEELSSSLHTSFIERSAFTDAFGFERRLGVSARYHAGDLLLQGGVFSDNIDALPSKAFSTDGRVAYMPRMGGTQLHFGASLHYAELNASGSSLRYRQRPFEHFTSERYLDTGSFSASSELGTGLEAAMIAGRFHAVGEAYWQKVSRRGLADPTFFGGYAELGYFLTGGDHRGYKDGQFDRVKPARPVGKGGPGAWQVNARYDYLDLSDAGIVGGRQNGYEVSLIWSQTAYTRLMLNYARLDYADAVYPTATGDRSYGVDVVAMRAQVDF